MRWIKRLFVLILIVAIGAGLWVGFGLWSGMYSVYTLSSLHRSIRMGRRCLIERADREPMFNSPDRAIPPPPPRDKSVGTGFFIRLRSAETHRKTHDRGTSLHRVGVQEIART